MVQHTAYILIKGATKGKRKGIKVSSIQISKYRPGMTFYAVRVSIPQHPDSSQNHTTPYPMFTHTHTHTHCSCGDHFSAALQYIYELAGQGD